MIERFRGIAAHINDKTGVMMSDVHLRRLAARKHDPLPVRKFLGRVVAEDKALDAWIARQWHPRGGGSDR